MNHQRPKWHPAAAAAILLVSESIVRALGRLSCVLSLYHLPCQERSGYTDTACSQTRGTMGPGFPSFGFPKRHDEPGGGFRGAC